MMDVDRALSPEERKLFTPRDVRVGLLGNGRRSVSWTPPASERPVASYRVWSDAVQVAEVPGTQTSEIVQLDGARTHYIQVQAVDADGNESNLTVHWVIGRPTADHRMNPRAGADRDPQESVDAPGWKWIPEQSSYLWWDGERYAGRANWDGTQWQIQQPVSESVPPMRGQWRGVVVSGVVVGAMLLWIVVLTGWFRGSPLQLEGTHHVLHSVSDPLMVHTGLAPGAGPGECSPRKTLWWDSMAGGTVRIEGNADFESPESVITVRNADRSIRWTRQEPYAFACATVAGEVLVVELTAFTEDTFLCQASKCWKAHPGLQAFDLATGEPLWWATADHTIEQLGAIDDIVIVLAGSSRIFDSAWDVHALEAKSGEELWNAGSDDIGGERLTIEGAVVYVQLAAEGVPIRDFEAGAPAGEPRYVAWNALTGQPVPVSDEEQLGQVGP